MELTEISLPLPECWDYRHVPLYRATRRNLGERRQPKHAAYGVALAVQHSRKVKLWKQKVDFRLPLGSGVEQTDHRGFEDRRIHSHLIPNLSYELWVVNMSVQVCCN